MKSYDYIIVGAGSSGCVLANRLSAAGDARVLLIEAGLRPDRFAFKLPIALTKLWFDPAVTWSYQTEPEPGLNQRRLPVPRGRVLGGSSAINGMVCTRGAPYDYDRWRDMGLEGWGFRDVLPYFKRLETHWRGASGYHGDSGPLRVSPHPTRNQYTDAAFAAARACGFTETDDFCGARPEGFGMPDFSTRRGRRVSAADAYLTPVLGRSNLEISTGVRVLRVLLEGSRAVGVEYLQDGRKVSARAEREVVLSGGAINSPHLLMLSGIGPAAELSRCGIGTSVSLPGVGRNLEDQPAARFSVAADSAISFNRQLRLDRATAAALRWFINGDGPFAAPPLLVSFIVKTTPDAVAPDMRTMINPLGMDARLWFPGLRKQSPPVLTAAFSLCYPQSRGSLTLAAADPLTPPRIQFNVLSNPEDVKEMRRGYRIMREMLQQPSLAPYAGAMTLPAKEPRTDQEIDSYLRDYAATTFHPIGSCRMGTGADAVVDDQLRVHGVERLRVVDTAVFPTQIGGNPSVPAMMLAEKAADMMLGRPPLPREIQA
jgi:choline dehydrogenase